MGLLADQNHRHLGGVREETAISESCRDEESQQEEIHTWRDRQDNRRVGFGEYRQETYGGSYSDARLGGGRISYIEYLQKLKMEIGPVRKISERPWGTVSSEARKLIMREGCVGLKVNCFGR